MEPDRARAHALDGDAAVPLRRRLQSPEDVDLSRPLNAVEFEYRLVGTGWSEARFAVGGPSVSVTASYLEDALGDLLLDPMAVDVRPGR